MPDRMVQCEYLPYWLEEYAHYHPSALTVNINKKVSHFVFYINAGDGAYSSVYKVRRAED